MPKKKWAVPELIVLVRSAPGEAVLTVCKTGWADGAGPASGDFLCRSYAPGGACPECSTIAAS